jgi:hypothetical protein
VNHAAELLERAEGAGVVLALDGERLRCSAPGGHIEDGLRAELAARKAELAAELRRRADQEGAAGPQAPIQHSLYYEYLLDPDSDAYNMGMWFSLEGELDLARLSEALRQLVRRHATLRTCFPDDGALIQRVLGAELFEMAVLPCEAGSITPERIAAVIDRPFALADGLPVRAALLRETPQRATLVFSIHHLAADASSLAMLFAELGQLYRSPGVALPAVGRSYLDYARAQQRWQESAAWRERLAQYLTACERFPPPMQLGGSGEPDSMVSLPFALEPDELAGLDACARHVRCTRYELVLAALARALGAITARDEVIIGSTVSTRDNSELGRTVGYFINLVPMHIQVRSAATPEWLADVRASARAAMAYAAIPFSEVQKHALRRPDYAGRQIIQVNLTYVGLGFDAGDWGGLHVGAPQARTTRAKFAINVQLHDDRLGLRGHIQCDARRADVSLAAELGLLCRGQLRDLVSACLPAPAG